MLNRWIFWVYVCENPEHATHFTITQKVFVVHITKPSSWLPGYTTFYSGNLEYDAIKI